MSALLEWEAWRDKRLAAVVSPKGNLSLIATKWQGDTNEISLSEALAGQPTTVQVTREVRKDFYGVVVERGIRLWDSNSEGIQAFETIEIYPYDANLVFDATFKAHDSLKPVPYEYIREKGGSRDLAVPGVINLELDGVNYSLDAFDDEGTLILVFADPTNGAETYPSGRFLFVNRDPNSNHITLDFNKAFVPPCGFSAHYNCPMPPPQNRLHVPIKAGERNPIFRNGYQIH